MIKMLLNIKKLTINTLNRRLSVCCFWLMAVACGTPKDVSYIQNAEANEKIEIPTNPTLLYKPNDILNISVSASDPEAALAFNKNNNSGDTETMASEAKSLYLIDENGNIEFPVLGTLKVGNLTSVEVKLLLKDLLKTYIKNPIVSVKLDNFKITILGEVSSPGTFIIDDERISILESIGLAGDLGIQGKRTNVTVLRMENGQQIVHKLDLTSKELFNSPAYYLAQNDVVYVEPNKHRAKASKNNEWPRILTAGTSVIGIIISIIAITR